MIEIGYSGVKTGITEIFLFRVPLPSYLLSAGLKLQSNECLRAFGNKVREERFQDFSRSCSTPCNTPCESYVGCDTTPERGSKQFDDLPVLHGDMELELEVPGFVLGDAIDVRLTNYNRAFTVENSGKIRNDGRTSCHVDSPETEGELGGRLNVLQWNISTHGNTEPSHDPAAVSGHGRCDGQVVSWQSNNPPKSALLEREDMTWAIPKGIEAEIKSSCDNKTGKFYNQPITIPYTDVLLNSGPTGVLDIVKLKEETAMASLLQKLARALWGVAPQNTSLDVDSLTAAVQNATNTYAGINRSTAGNEFWKPGGTQQANRTASGNLNMTDLLNGYGDVTFGNEEPDTCITTQTGFNSFELLLIGNQRYTRDEDTVRAGFRRHLMLNNAVVFHDQFAPSGTWTYLNTKYVYPAFHQDDYFVVDPFIRPSNQRILSSFIWLTWNMQVVNPRMNQAILSIPNA